MHEDQSLIPALALGDDPADTKETAASSDLVGFMVIGSGQQGGLKEYHGDIPYRRRTAQERQHHLGKHGLYPKQQQGAQTQCHGVKCQHMKLNQ